MNPAIGPSKIQTVAVLGNHLPRHCGIATFTTDLSTSLATEFPELDCFVMAMNDAGRRHAYPGRVRFELAEGDYASYRRATDFLNVNGVDVVSVQHEYGIFGGKAGSFLLGLLRELRMPIVTTLHTILPEPDAVHRDVMDEVTKLSERIVVMSESGARLLRSIHDVPAGKIDLIPHGIPIAPSARRSKDQLGVEGKSVILTFGLLSPDKGIEHVIDALPLIVTQFPNVLYIVLGTTHPHIREQHGETYRLGLETRAQRLGVAANILFHDRFVTQAELAEFLAAADVYVTPYLKAEQSTSGTLAYAVGAGKAVISTPYSHALEMLADDRGIIVPWRDPAAIAREVIGLLGDEERRLAMAKRAAEYGSDMVWPTVARRHHASLERACSDHAERRRTVFQARTLAERPPERPAINLEHVELMTDSTGILQHAVFSVPRYDDGYCLDDNARALLLMALIEDAGTANAGVTRALVSRYLAFVSHAFVDSLNRFRNFMTYSRQWVEEIGSEDSHGRALWALGVVVGRSHDPGRQSHARALFHKALEAVSEFTSPRAWAFTLLGIDEYLRAFQGDSNVQALRESLGVRLLGLHQRTSRDDWPWFEDRVTYENARLSQAMLATGARMQNPEMIEVGLRSLEWLVSIQTSTDGYFAPIGSNGFYVRGGSRAAFDQQPIEACAMIAACLEARRVSGEDAWAVRARQSFGWFLGHNHLQQPLYDAATGGCRDGIHADRLNANQGAESTLSFQLALLDMLGVELTSIKRPVLQAVMA